MTMKKILLLLAVLVSISSGAQNAVGDWRIHTSFVGDKVTAVADTRNWVYYLSETNLFRLDKETQENEALSKINDLSDMGIVNIYYNSDNDYIVIVYANSNIDIIKSDGSVVNMPEIKDAVLTTDKNINDVTFADGVIYLATDFGYVVIDDNKFVVKESHIYGEALTSVAQVGNLLLLSTADNFYYGDVDEFHEQLSSFDQSSFTSDCRIRPINDDTFFYLTGWTSLATITETEQGVVKFQYETIARNKTSDIQKIEGGYLLNMPSVEQYLQTDENGRNGVVTKTDGEVCSSNPDGDGTIWAAGKQGLHEFGDDNYYLPNALSFSTPFWMSYNKDKDLLYVSSTANNAFFRTSSPTVINTYDGMKWTDVTPEGAPRHGSFGLEFLPDDPDTYLLSTWRDGLYKVTDNEIVQIYNLDNSPLAEKYAMHPIPSIDRNGNLWVLQSYENPDHPAMVLPAAKLKLNNTTASDWMLPTIDGLNTGHTQRESFISTKNSSYDIKIFTDGDYQMPLFLWNTAGEIPSRPSQVSFSELIDQDGQIVSWTYIMSLTEDLGGTVWMGTTEGICVFNPAKAFSGSFSVVRPKVPRNDGTGMADRLMDGIQVNDIAVDGANRKWIATQSSGIFLVNADGTQIIKKFNKDNSPLASNTVYRVCCNPNSNSVYLTTPVGLYEYFSDSGPAQSTYDEIYAYPNPVRPDYGGDVTIVGLMDNSLVKIADASGNVICQLKSTGGMATWDCCNQNGDPVKTGVYLVLCSQANGSGNSAVAKIVVIR